MKKIFVFIMLIFSNIIFADFLNEFQKIDTLMQSKNYDKALESAKILLNSNISSDEKKTLEVVIKEIEARKITNTGQNNFEIGSNIQTNDELSASNDGTLPVLPTELISDGSKFSSYKEYERQVLETNNPIAINQLAMLYIKDGLYESAAKLALKDKTESPENLYLAATAFRMIGKYDTSISLYNKVLSINSNHAKSYLGIAMAYKGKAEFKKALKYMQTYSKYNSSSEVMNDIKILRAQ